MLDTMDAMRLAIGLASGLVLGLLFFGGLWWTVRRLPRSSRPVALYLGSMVVRAGAALAGFYLVLTYYDWPQLAAALVGFLVVRVALVRMASPVEPPMGKAT